MHSRRVTLDYLQPGDNLLTAPVAGLDTVTSLEENIATAQEKVHTLARTVILPAMVLCFCCDTLMK